jgi:hypothetical protein
VRSARHGGLTPPLLVARCSFAAKNDIRGAQTHVRKSGGRQPAVVRQTRLRRHEGDCSENRRQYVGRSPLPSRPAIPRGAYAPRSWLHGAGSPEKTAAAVSTELRCEKRHSRCTNARFQERRASARRGLRNAITVKLRLLPGNERDRERRSSARRGNVTHLRRSLFPTAGLRQPLLFHGAGRLKNDDIRDAQTHVYKSGGRQPAVGIANASAVALVCHGRLTPTALVLRCERLSAKNVFCDEQTHFYKSGGRQPAVAFRTASPSAMR